MIHRQVFFSQGPARIQRLCITSKAHAETGAIAAQVPYRFGHRALRASGQAVVKVERIGKGLAFNRQFFCVVQFEFVVHIFLVEKDLLYTTQLACEKSRPKNRYFEYLGPNCAAYYLPQLLRHKGFLQTIIKGRQTGIALF